MSNTDKKNLTPATFWAAMGVGILAAPFTGGMSLAYAASHIVIASAVDIHKDTKTDSNN